MKKSFIIGKRQILLGFLILVLGGAVYFNWYLNNNGTNQDVSETITDSNLGDAVFVNANASNNGDEYFSETRKNREEARNKSLESLKEIVDNPKSDSSSVKAASDEAVRISTFSNIESNVESLVKAKGFEDCIAIMSAKDISVLVMCDKLLSSDTIQIQDIAATATGYSYENIKIIEVKNSWEVWKMCYNVYKGDDSNE